MKRIQKSGYIVSIVIMLAACGVATPTPATIDVATRIPAFTTETYITPIVTEHPTLSPQERESTRVAGVENLIATHAVITPVFNEPSITLSPQEMETTIEYLLSTNAGCSLPCFWGITPSVTSWEDAAKTLQTAGATIVDIKTDPSTSYHSVLFRNDVLTAGDGFGFLEASNVVTSIHANAWGAGFPSHGGKELTALWESYAPREIVHKYGIPSRVLLSSVVAIGFGDTGRHGYILWVFYDHLGFMIRYDGSVLDLPVYHVCPQFRDDGSDITQIRLTMQNPSNPFPLESHDSILADLAVPRVILPIEDAAGINMEDFYNLFAGEDDQSCFDTPREIWKLEQ